MKAATGYTKILLQQSCTVWRARDPVWHDLCLCFQRLAIELFRHQTSRSSSPPDLRLAAGSVGSDRDPRSAKIDDDIQTTSTNSKKGEEEERTQQDDSNVRMENILALHSAFKKKFKLAYHCGHFCKSAG